MEALGWAWIGLMSIAWLALLHRAREPVAFERERRLPARESRKPAATRPRRATRTRRLWLDYKPPTE